MVNIGLGVPFSMHTFIDLQVISDLSIGLRWISSWLPGWSNSSMVSSKSVIPGIYAFYTCIDTNASVWTFDTRWYSLLHPGAIQNTYTEDCRVKKTLHLPSIGLITQFYEIEYYLIIIQFLLQDDARKLNVSIYRFAHQKEHSTSISFRTTAR